MGLTVQGLISPIPDKSALKLGILAYQFPIVGEVAAGVAHRMVILTLDERFGELLIVSVPLAGVNRVVHRVEDVSGTSFDGCLLKLYRAAVILTLDPIVGGIEVGRIFRLVAQAPDDDARIGGWMPLMVRLMEPSYLIWALPCLPRFVVTRMTPAAAREP